MAVANALFNLVGWVYVHMRAAHEWNPAATADVIVDLLLRGIASAREQS